MMNHSYPAARMAGAISGLKHISGGKNPHGFQVAQKAALFVREFSATERLRAASGMSGRMGWYLPLPTNSTWPFSASTRSDVTMSPSPC